MIIVNRSSQEAIQYLEGEREVIRDLFENHIKNDDRHSKLMMFVDRGTDERMYSKYGLFLGDARDWAGVKQLLPPSCPHSVIQQFDGSVVLQSSACYLKDAYRSNTSMELMGMSQKAQQRRRMSRNFDDTVSFEDGMDANQGPNGDWMTDAIQEEKPRSKGACVVS